MGRLTIGRRGFVLAATSAATLTIVPYRFAVAQAAPPPAPGAISLADLNRMPPAEFVKAISQVFEAVPWVAEAVQGKRPFATVADLHKAMIDALRGAPREQQVAYLNHHPDLASASARAGTINQTSHGEQAGVGLLSMSEQDTARFQQLNEAYKKKFGFPFVIAVRRHTLESMLANFERRVQNEPAVELAAALQEIFYISRLRMASMVTGPGIPVVWGWLDTHVLDATSGGPAVGMSIELFQFMGDRAISMVKTMTNADGRIDKPLIGGGPVPIGRYELRFGVGDYFKTRAKGLADPPFLDIVPLRFSVAQPETHYHVPLLCTPWSYSTYKGS